MSPETLSLLTRSLNTAIVFVLAYGLLKRRTASVHIPVMLVAFVVDLVNVLLVEVLGRIGKEGTGAVEQAGKAIFQGGTALQQVHITASFLCIVGYIVAIITGTRLHRRGTGRSAHRANAAVFIATRLTSYVTSFWM